MSRVPVVESVERVIKTGWQSDDVVSMDSRAIDFFSRAAAEAEVNKNSVLNDMEKNVKIDPEVLIKIQDRVLNYNIELSLISTIARKVVGAAETLLKS